MFCYLVSTVSLFVVIDFVVLVLFAVLVCLLLFYFVVVLKFRRFLFPKCGKFLD